MKKRFTLGIGHYGIGFKDGVNTVIYRNVKAMMSIAPHIKFVLFGKISPDYNNFLKPVRGKLEYLNIDEFDPAQAAKTFGSKSISEQKIQDYIWQGTNIAEILLSKLDRMDVIMAENLGIGIHPAVTYSFYLYSNYCHMKDLGKKFVYRVHDFVQERRENFENFKKFSQNPFEIVPNWHDVLYPNTPNVKYIAISHNDFSRLVEHGIDEKNIFYVPNCVDEDIIPADDESKTLRERIVRKYNIPPDSYLVLYPVRCVRRKNVEEAIFLTQLFNVLAQEETYMEECKLSGKFHLLVSISPNTGDDYDYTQQLRKFVAKHHLPVTIGVDDLVSLKRVYNRKGKIEKYAVGDLYQSVDLVVTTSILEGFGFVYIEPWILDKAVIGRSVPIVTPDFQASGMKLGHMYNALLVDNQDFKDIGKGQSPNKALAMRLSKIPKLKKARFVENTIRKNEVPILATLQLIQHESKRKKLIEINKGIVEKTYSKEAVGRMLYKVMTE